MIYSAKLALIQSLNEKVITKKFYFDIFYVSYATSNISEKDVSLDVLVFVLDAVVYSKTGNRLFCRSKRNNFLFFTRKLTVTLTI